MAVFPVDQYFQDVMTSCPQNLGVQANIFGRIYAQTPANGNPGLCKCRLPFALDWCLTHLIELANSLYCWIEAGDATPRSPYLCQQPGSAEPRQVVVSAVGRPAEAGKDPTGSMPR